MAPYTIRVFGDPVLKQRATEIDNIDGALVRLAEDMLTTMYDAPGLGLAAPQVGVQKRLFVYDIDDEPSVLVNPVITESRGEWTYLEGCLSVPDLHWDIVRPKEILITGYDLDGNEVEIEADELMARLLPARARPPRRRAAARAPRRRAAQGGQEGPASAGHRARPTSRSRPSAAWASAFASPGPARTRVRAPLADDAPPMTAPVPVVPAGSSTSARRTWRCRRCVALHAAGFEIALVVSRADAKRGRGRRAGRPAR